MVRRRRRVAHAEPPAESELTSEARSLSRPLRTADDLDPLMDRIGDAPYVLLGEASHGTHEYYTWRTTISQRLIEEKGFSFIAVEGDWPNCYRVNRYAKGHADSGESAHDVLHAFQRWPTWMWANEEVIELTEWLRTHNAGLPEADKVGFWRKQRRCVRFTTSNRCTTARCRKPTLRACEEAESTSCEGEPRWFLKIEPTPVVG